MKTLYFIRHGETVDNAEGRFGGWRDSPLTDKGKLQAAEMAARLRQYPIEVLYSSDLIRAVDTASYIGQNLKSRPVQEKALREIHMGKWEGMRFKDLELTSGEQDAWFEGYSDFCYPGGESPADVLKRALDFLEDILLKDANHIAIVSHGLLITVLIAHLAFKDYRLMSGMQMDNGGIAILEIEAGYHYLKKLNG